MSDKKFVVLVLKLVFCEATGTVRLVCEVFACFAIALARASSAVMGMRCASKYFKIQTCANDN